MGYRILTVEIHGISEWKAMDIGTLLKEYNGMP